MKTIVALLVLVILVLLFVSIFLNKLYAEFDAMRKNIYSNFNTVSQLIDNIESAVSRLNTTTNSLINNINTRDNNNKIKIESIQNEVKDLTKAFGTISQWYVELSAAIKANKQKKVSTKRVNKDSSPVRDETKK